MYAWVEDAGAHDVFPDKTHVVCMDRTGYPQRVGVFDFEGDMQDVKKIIEATDCEALLRNERTAPYVHWMRANRQIFEFVDGVGCYESGWWLDSQRLHFPKAPVQFTCVP